MSEEVSKFVLKINRYFSALLLLMRCFYFFSSRQASRSPICSRSLSPRSPRVDKVMPPDSSSGVGGARQLVCSEEEEVKEKVGDEVEARGKEEAQPVGAGENFLFQVSEAHLALYPDEDGDTYVFLCGYCCCGCFMPVPIVGSTCNSNISACCGYSCLMPHLLSQLVIYIRPLHLAIIHANVRLTRYLIHLIKMVQTRNTNFDIANNMRQVLLATQYMCTIKIPYLVHLPTCM